MKDGSNQSDWEEDEEVASRTDSDPLAAVIFDFEDTGDSLSLLPLAARRALDVAGFRLSLEGWQSLGARERKELSVEGGRDGVDASTVESSVRRSAIPATRIRPVPDPDPLIPPEQLSTFLGPRRAIDPAQWARLRALDRYALVHVLRRSIAHDDPIRLEAAIATILPRGASIRPTPADRRAAAKAARRLSPGPASPARAAKQKDSSATVRPGPATARPLAPMTERRASPVTSRSEREAARPIRSSNGPVEAISMSQAERSQGERRGEPARVLVRTGLRNQPRTDLRSDPPPEEPSFGGRGQRDTLDSETEAVRGSRRPLEPIGLRGGLGRGIHQLDDVSERLDEYSDRDDDSLPPLDSDPPENQSFSSHLSSDGEARMVDIGDKPTTSRRAEAQGVVRMRRETARRILDSDVPKGDALSVARIAGIMAAKRTPELIPLCHHVALTKVEVQIDVDARAGLVTVGAVVEARDRTGVEMEALAAVTAACLAIYDMLKGIDRDMSLSDIKLLEKSGGRTGTYVRRED